jgi:hypothetical protein
MLKFYTLIIHYSLFEPVFQRSCRKGREITANIGGSVGHGSCPPGLRLTGQILRTNILPRFAAQVLKTNILPRFAAQVLKTNILLRFAAQKFLVEDDGIEPPTLCL